MIPKKSLSRAGVSCMSLNLSMIFPPYYKKFVYGFHFDSESDGKMRKQNKEVCSEGL